MAGRKTKLNRKIIDKICSGIEKGYSYKRALQEAGIPERTFYNWKKHAEIAFEKGQLSGVLLQLIQSLEQAQDRWLLELHKKYYKHKPSRYFKNIKKPFVKIRLDENSEPIEVIIEATNTIPTDKAISKNRLAGTFPTDLAQKEFWEKLDKLKSLKAVAEMLIISKDNGIYTLDVETIPVDGHA
jgi:hypothetical protein